MYARSERKILDRVEVRWLLLAILDDLINFLQKLQTTFKCKTSAVHSRLGHQHRVDNRLIFGRILWEAFKLGHFIFYPNDLS
jgi:hypothetical protein